MSNKERQEKKHSCAAALIENYPTNSDLINSIDLFAMFKEWYSRVFPNCIETFLASLVVVFLFPIRNAFEYFSSQEELFPSLIDISNLSLTLSLPKSADIETSLLTPITAGRSIKWWQRLRSKRALSLSHYHRRPFNLNAGRQAAFCLLDRGKGVEREEIHCRKVLLNCGQQAVFVDTARLVNWRRRNFPKNPNN